MNIAPTSKKIAINAVMTGVVAGILTKYYFGDIENVEYFGMSVSAPFASGLGCGVGSVISDLTHELVIKRLGITNQMMNSASLGVQVGIGGVASAGVLYFGGLPVQNVLPAVALGAGSKLAGDYLNYKVFDPRDGILGAVF